MGADTKIQWCIMPPVIPRDGLDLDSVETDARNGYFVSAGTALGLVAMVRDARAEVERLKGGERNSAVDCCEHGVTDGDFCEACRKDYRAARAENGDDDA